MVWPEEVPRYDKNCNGTFKDGSAVYTQFNGTTITVGKAENLDVGPYVTITIYNGDASKLNVNVRNTKMINTYDYDKNPFNAFYVMKDGKRLIEYYGTEDIKKDTLTKCKIEFGDPREIMTGTGFVKGTVTVDVSYNNKQIAKRTFMVNKDADSRGLSARRAEWLAFAEKAVEENGGKKSYIEDMNAVKWYVPKFDKWTKVGGLYLDCTGGSAILETYSIYHYGVYGFGGYGSQRPGMPNYGSHVAFHLDSDPLDYWETQGSHLN